MEINLKTLQIIIKIIFLGIVPFALIYLRFKKKIGTGFAVGVFLLSFIISLIGVASIYSDPYDLFYEAINSRNYGEAKKNYRILVQFGEEGLVKIDENKIIYKELYSKIKKELAGEYEEIASKYLRTKGPGEMNDCSKFTEYEKGLNNLRHAQKISQYSLNVGGRNRKLNRELSKAVEQKTLEFETFSEKCGK